ncbi:MAG: SDR family oxidoreductase [Planctomycetes bacterium]|nr:SDR family oxidoreductase [Planctomycetota bacterium]
MPTLLITGVSGMLGWTFSLEAAERFDVVGTFCSHPVEMGHGKILALDICDADAVRATLEDVAPDVVVHLAAISNTNACERVPALSRRVNLEASLTLAELCARREIPLVFSSSDLVFAGDKPPYAEDDEPQPSNVYGMHKAGAERGIRDVHESAAICRLPLLFGPPSPAYPASRGSFMQGWLETLRRGEPLNLFVDEFRTPVSARDASQGLLLIVDELLARRQVATMHLGGPERLSRYDFGLLMCDAFTLPRDLINPCAQVDVHMDAARPKDVSLSSERARALGFDPMPIIEGLGLISKIA